MITLDMNTDDDIFEKHAKAQDNGYYDDSRWKEVELLRKNGENLKANGLIFTIRDDWEL